MSHSAGGRFSQKGTKMDKGKDSTGVSKSRRLSEMTVIFVIVVSFVLVAAELAVNILKEQDRKAAKSENGYFVATPPGQLNQQEAD